ncbi:MAG TPA: hypothetical protein VJJ73_02305 [Candidatus Paceibacterota bacterium]
MFNALVYFYILLPLILGVIGVWLYFRRKNERKRIIDSLRYVLYEVTLPQEKLAEGETFKNSIGLMGKLYSLMSHEKWTSALEIGLPETGEEVVFYASVPEGKAQLFEKQIQGLFPRANLKRRRADYNIFKPTGIALGSVIILKAPYVLPIKTFDKFESDPLTLLMNTFSKLKREGEGAALQILVREGDEKLLKGVKMIIKKVSKGDSLSKAMKHEESFIKDFGKALLRLFIGYKGKNKDAEGEKVGDQAALKLLEEKSSQTFLSVNMRIIASGETEERARSILTEIESAFAQFTEAQGNGFSFIHPEGGRLKNLLYLFSFRIPDEERAMTLNTAELATVFHFPHGIEGVSAPQLKYAKTKEAAPPMNLPQKGVLLGNNVYRGTTMPVYMGDDDRRRHLYIIGQTGTGKSHLIKNVVIQDIARGKGVCFIDPHGSDIEDVLARIPRERVDDVIYFDPGETARPMGLNMLEYDPRYPEQKTFVVNELLSIFNKLFDMKIAGGPAFEQYFRNSALLVMEHPESGNTLMDISRVLADKNFREMKLSHSTNPIVSQFWRNAEQTTGEQSLANFVPYITNKFDAFVSNEIMRPIIGQTRSAFNFRGVMDGQKILLVNLSKGRLGDLNSSLIGLVIVGKLLMAALSRVDVAETDRKDFYLYIDEFQNVTTDSIATILSEARKYRLDLTIAHQFVGQLGEEIKKAVFGNVGSMAIFRVGADDAEPLQKQVEPVFNSYDLMNIDNYNAYLRLLINGEPSRPFNIQTIPFEKGDATYAKDIVRLSSLKYGRRREEVEEEIRGKYS